MRPTLALCCILKDEELHISRFIQQFKGCFDQIVFVDTGSTDKSIEMILKANEKIREKHPDWLDLPEIQLEHFTWINDFAAAREYSFSFAKTDYVFWADFDDSISDKDAFINFRDTVMHSADYWMATYNYAFDANGKPTTSFLRERVIKNNSGFHWNEFIHEGCVQTEGKPYWPNRVTTWTVDHMRTKEDQEKDFLRNIKIIESNLDRLSPRLWFYYGKELFDAGFTDKSIKPLVEALSHQSLAHNDRVLAFQYVTQALHKKKDYVKAIDMAFKGLSIYPQRAEIWCVLGDLYLEINERAKAMFAYKTASGCFLDTFGDTTVVSSLAYNEYPHMRLAELLSQGNDVEGSLFHLNMLKDVNPAAYEQAAKTRSHNLSFFSRTSKIKTEDILITCPPGSLITNFDELSTKAFGGSETALIAVAKELHEQTGRPVKVFQARDNYKTMPSGVEYYPSGDLAGYVKHIEPAFHLAWRHATSVTEAPSYVWHHDLVTPGIENQSAYAGIISLSEFHKNYVHHMFGIPREKIWVWRNGIDCSQIQKAEKVPGKIIFSSSPDRGLKESIEIVRLARLKSGRDLKLHLFYGFNNMLADPNQKQFISECMALLDQHQDFVTMHGMVDKATLYRHFAESEVWLYPSNFIETYCITAIEALAHGAYPLVRRMGALPDTLKDQPARILDLGIARAEDLAKWSDELLDVLDKELWKTMSVDVQKFSWTSAVKDLVLQYGL